MASFTEALSNVVLYGWSNVSKLNVIIILIQRIIYIFNEIIILIQQIIYIFSEIIIYIKCILGRVVT